MVAVYSVLDGVVNNRLSIREEEEGGGGTTRTTTKKATTRATKKKEEKKEGAAASDDDDDDDQVSDDDDKELWSTTDRPEFFETSGSGGRRPFLRNSHEWLVGPRVGNSVDMPDSYVRKLLLLRGIGIGDGRSMGVGGGYGQRRSSSSSSSAQQQRREKRSRNGVDMYLSQSVCHPQSRFRRTRDDLDDSGDHGHVGADDGGVDIGTAVDEEGTTDVENDEYEEYDYNNPSDAVKVWTTRLVYLATIYHQHRYALPEAKARYSRSGVPAPSTSSTLHSYTTSNTSASNNTGWQPQAILAQNYGVGNYDYECQGAKFIVAALGGNGLGINVRGGIIEALLAGLTSNRVVLLINNHSNSTAGTVHPTLTRPWPLASCPRHDYQCFFFPITPCVLTHRDLADAYTLTQFEIRNLRKGIVPTSSSGDESVHNKTVWVHTLTGTPHLDIPPLAAERLYNYSMKMLEDGTLEAWAAVQWKDGHKKNRTGGRRQRRRQRLLRRAANNILRRNVTRRPLYNYAAANVPIVHALAVVATRPNLRSAKLLQDLLSTSLSSSANKGAVGAELGQFIDPDRTVVGLPIRASDKCLKESECLSFQQHLEATSLLLQVYHGNQVGPGPFQLPTHQRVNASAVTLVVTSESIEMAHAFQQFKTNDTAQSLLPFRFRLVTNDADVTPNTGFALSALRSSSLARNLSFTADDMMLSAMSSLQHQLLAQITIANCCSNFHVLLADLHMAGCGASASAPRPHTLHCLQEHMDPRYQLCCGWFKNCKEQKRLAIEEFMAKQREGLEPSNRSTTTA